MSGFAFGCLVIVFSTRDELPHSSRSHLLESSRMLEESVMTARYLPRNDIGFIQRDAHVASLQLSPRTTFPTRLVL